MYVTRMTGIKVRDVSTRGSSSSCAEADEDPWVEKSLVFIPIILITYIAVAHKIIHFTIFVWFVVTIIYDVIIISRLP